MKRISNVILENGIEINAITGASNVSALLLTIEIGIANEISEQKGMTHLVEHLIVYHLLELKEIYGIWVNGFVTREHLCVLIQAQSGKMEKAIKCLQEMIVKLNSNLELFTEEQINVETEKIIFENERILKADESVKSEDVIRYILGKSGLDCVAYDTKEIKPFPTCMVNEYLNQVCRRKIKIYFSGEDSILYYCEKELGELLLNAVKTDKKRYIPHDEKINKILIPREAVIVGIPVCINNVREYLLYELFAIWIGRIRLPDIDIYFRRVKIYPFSMMAVLRIDIDTSSISSSEQKVITNEDIVFWLRESRNMISENNFDIAKNILGLSTANQLDSSKFQVLLKYKMDILNCSDFDFVELLDIIGGIELTDFMRLIDQIIMKSNNYVIE